MGRPLKERRSITFDPRQLAELTALGKRTRGGRSAVVRAAIAHGLPLLKAELAELHGEADEAAGAA